MVKVLPKDDSVRKFLKHPGGRVFPESGSTDWPDDSFTHRRIADGDVIVEEQQQEGAKGADYDPSAPALSEGANGPTGPIGSSEKPKETGASGKSRDK